MGRNSSINPKASVTLNSIGGGFGKDNVALAGNATLRHRSGKFAASLAFSDKTVKNVQSMQDVIATLDFAAPRNVTLNGKYELGPKKYTVGATWNGSIARKGTTLKLWYSNKDNLISGDTTVNLAKDKKVNVTFNQKQLQTAKLTYTRGDYMVEPSYNFLRKAPAIAVTRKMSLKDTLKLSYDIKSEAAAAEWVRKPFKVVLSSTVSKKLQVGRPTLSAIFENVYDI